LLGDVQGVRYNVIASRGSLVHRVSGGGRFDANDAGGEVMTRILALLSAVMLSVGALQLHAGVPVPSDGSSSCGGGSGPICESRTVRKCVEWRGEKFEISGPSVSGGYSITCAKWEETTTKTYYSS
jgi:hypothetical protein